VWGRGNCCYFDKYEVSNTQIWGCCSNRGQNYSNKNTHSKKEVSFIVSWRPLKTTFLKRATRVCFLYQITLTWWFMNYEYGKNNAYIFWVFFFNFVMKWSGHFGYEFLDLKKPNTDFCRRNTEGFQQLRHLHPDLTGIYVPDDYIRRFDMTSFMTWSWHEMICHHFRSNFSRHDCSHGHLELPYMDSYLIFVREHGVHAGPKDYFVVVVVIRGFV
jgi:hypothetical protein